MNDDKTLTMRGTFLGPKLFSIVNIYPNTTYFLYTFSDILQ